MGDETLTVTSFQWRKSPFSKGKTVYMKQEAL